MYTRESKSKWSGSYSNIYLASLQNGGKNFVWKEPKPDNVPADVERFRREIEICAKLNHPNIIAIEYADLLAPVPYIVMPRLEQNLDIAIRYDQASRLDRMAIFENICQGLIYLHNHGVLHRDLKPSNILLNINNEAVISDLGLARDIDSSRLRLTKINETGGTHPYSAPEQYNSSLRDIDERADVFSLGMVLYFIFTGNHPYHFDRSLVSNPIYQLVKKATDRDLNERFQSVKAFRDEFLKTVAYPKGRYFVNPVPQNKRFVGLQVEIQKLAKHSKGRIYYQDKDIEKIVSNLHDLIWDNRDLLGGDLVNDRKIDMLNAPAVLQILGFDLQYKAALATYQVKGNEYEVAAQLDQPNKKVVISQRFPKEVMRFTEAHELGHAVLHVQNKLHRDRPLNGSQIYKKSHPVEHQANKFATFFLMPKMQVLERFKEIFRVDKFVMNKEFSELLLRGDPHESYAYLNDVDMLARFLATVDQVGSMRVKSLAQYFNVSAGAMAIRIKELGLV